MTLKHPQVVLTSTKHHYTTTPQRVRLDRDLARKGLAEHEIAVLEGESKFAPRAVLLWPKDLPGVVALELWEEPRVRYYDRTKKVDVEEAEKDDVATPLCRVLLSRAPGEKRVRAHPDAVPIWSEDTVFEGALADLNLLVIDGERADGDVSQRLRVIGVPILRSSRGVEDEGGTWELGARLRFDPRPYRTTEPPFGERVVARTGSNHWHEGIRETVSRSFATLPYMKTVTFRVRRGEDDTTPVKVQDRYIFALHTTEGVVGKTPQTIYRTELIHQHQGVGGKVVEVTVTPKATTDRRKAMPALLGKDKRSKKLQPGDFAEVRGKQVSWLEDLVITSPPPAETGVGGAPFRNVNATSRYWLLPDDYWETRKASLRDVVEKGRMTTFDQVNASTVDEVVFTLGDPWDVFASDLQEVIQHLEMCRAWQEKYESYYRQHRQELETFSRIVRPIVDGLQDVRFKTRNSTGGSHQKRFADLRSAVETGKTERKLNALRLFTDRIRYHVERALAVLSRKRFKDVFGTKQFLGANKSVRWETHHDAIPGHERLYHVTTPGHRYAYDDDLKTFIVAATANCFPLLAAPDLEDERKNRLKLQKRIATFREVVAPPIVELVQSKLAGEGNEAIVSFLTSKLSAVKFWSVMGGGGFYIFLYGTDAHRELVTEAIKEVAASRNLPSTGAKAARGLWKLDDDEWDAMAGKIAAREGFGSLDVVEIGIGVLKFGIDVHKLATTDAKDVGVGTALDIADVILSGAELGLKVTKLIQPDWFKAGSGGEFALKSVGNALKVLSVLKDLHSIYKTLWRTRQGALRHDDKILFAMANIAATAVAFLVPVVGAVLGALIMFLQALLDYFSLSGWEAPMAWYCRTPYGHSPFRDYKEEFGALPLDKPLHMFVAAMNAMNAFLEELLEAMDDPEKVQPTLRAYLEGYARSNAKMWGLSVEVVDKEKILVIHLKKDGKWATSR